METDEYHNKDINSKFQITLNITDIGTALDDFGKSRVVPRAFNQLDHMLAQLVSWCVD